MLGVCRDCLEPELPYELAKEVLLDIKGSIHSENELLDVSNT